MTTAPTVSVVLCTYNGESHLQEQLDSLVQQDYPHLELIISDDASSDGTVAMLKSYASADSRIKLTLNDVNAGYNRNFQQAIVQSTGEYIAIADQDDIWELSKISVMMKAFGQDDATLLVHSLSATFRTGAEPDYRSLRKRQCFEGNDVRKLFLYNQISGHNMIVRRSLINRALPFPQDVYYDWWLAVVACCYGRIQCINKVLAYHRLHEKNVTVLEKQKPFHIQATEILPVLLSVNDMPADSKKFGEILLKGYMELKYKKFSFRLFRFILRHAHLIFSFRKYAFPYPSYVKRSYRLASADYVSKP